MIKAIIFDINGVVISPKYDKIYRMLKAGAHKIKAGPIEDAFMNKIIKLYRDEKSVNSDIIGLVSKLNGRGILTAALTNSPSDRKKVYEELDIYDKFDPFLTSEEIGFMKPHRSAYETVLDKMGVEPHECILVDDRRSNLEGANEIGMKSILYKNFKHLVKELRKMGVEIE